MIEEESVDASGQAKEKTSSNCDIVVEEQIFEPIRRSVLERPLKSVFDARETVPISLRAVPSCVQVVGLQSGPSAGQAQSSQQQKHGKGNKGNKNASKASDKAQA